MESLFIELKKNLEKQEENIKQLLNIAREHNRALRQLEAGMLAEIVAREEAAVSKINREEKARIRITGRLAKEIGIEKDAVLGEFTGKAPQKIKEELAALLESMTGTAQELAEINELNSSLTKQAMRFNEIILRMFAPAGKNAYTPNGKRADDSIKLSLLDRKV